MSVEQSRPPSRFRGLVPQTPLPEPIAEPQSLPEEQDAQRLQQELLRRYGVPGVVQQQVVIDRRVVEANQIQAAMSGQEVPTSSRKATASEVARVLQPTVIFIGEDDETRWPEGSVERMFLQTEKEAKRRKKKGA